MIEIKRSAIINASKYVFKCLQKSADDTSQFDEQFTATVPVDSPVESTLSESANMIFQVSFEIYCKYIVFEVIIKKL